MVFLTSKYDLWNHCCPGRDSYGHHFNLFLLSLWLLGWCCGNGYKKFDWSIKTRFHKHFLVDDYCICRCVRVHVYVFMCECHRQCFIGTTVENYEVILLPKGIYTTYVLVRGYVYGTKGKLPVFEIRLKNPLTLRLVRQLLSLGSLLLVYT